MEDFWYGMEMEWKKIASIEYRKIVFHSIPYHALPFVWSNLLLNLQRGGGMPQFCILFYIIKRPWRPKGGAMA